MYVRRNMEGCTRRVPKRVVEINRRKTSGAHSKRARESRPQKTTVNYFNIYIYIYDVCTSKEHGRMNKKSVVR